LAHKGVYGKTKSQADDLVRKSGLDWTILRPSLVYGEDPKTIFTTIAAFVKSLPFVPVLGNGEQPFRPVWVEDVAEAITRSVNNLKSFGKEYDLGSKEALTLNELIGKIQKVLRKEKQPIVHVPYVLSIMGALILREIMKDPPISVDNVLGSNQPTDCRPEKAYRDLKWNPIGVDQGIKKVLIGDLKGRLPVAIVGLGKMGTLHGAILSTFPEVRVTALVDKDVKLGKTILSMGMAGRFYTSLEEACKHEEIGAVFITTPTFAHKEIIQECLRRKLPFFVEKPVFTQWSDFLGLPQEKKKGLITAAGYFYSFRRPYVLAKELIDKRILGRLQSFRARLLISEVFREKHGWIFRKELSGGGVLMNPGPHVFGVLEKFFGRPEEVLASTRKIYSREVEDEGRINLTYKNGLSGEVFASWSVKGVPLTAVRVEVIGERGKMAVAEEGISLILKRGAKVANSLKGIKTQKRGKGVFIPVAQMPAPKEPTFVLSPAAGGEGYTLEDRAFISSILAKKKFPYDLDFAARVEKTIALCYQSAEEGRTIRGKRGVYR